MSDENQWKQLRDLRGPIEKLVQFLSSSAQKKLAINALNGARLDCSGNLSPNHEFTSFLIKNKTLVKLIKKEVILSES